MTNIVPAADIERIVGEQRHPTAHIGRAVSAEETVYILHSALCRDTNSDLRTCTYSRALDLGIYRDDWRDQEDQPVVLAVDDFGALVPSPEQTR